MDVEWIFAIAKVGKYWREGRKLLDRSLSPSEIASHRRMIEEKTRVSWPITFQPEGLPRTHRSVSPASHLSESC
jgi:hypothetical protein